MRFGLLWILFWVANASLALADNEIAAVVKIEKSGDEFLYSVNDERCEPQDFRAQIERALLDAKTRVGYRGKLDPRAVAVVFAADVPLTRVFEVDLIVGKVGFNLTRQFFLSPDAGKARELEYGDYRDPKDLTPFR